jgi:feruloyl esterase
VDYYEMAERIIGDRAATQDFYRLFMVPGRSHFDEDHYGGDGAAAGDFLSYLEAWVEKDEAPDMVLGYHAENWGDDAGELYRGLKNPDRYRFTRPHYPYPLWARYRGNGDPNDYRNFEPVDPEKQ